jgi:hypothetical protein
VRAWCQAQGGEGGWGLEGWGQCQPPTGEGGAKPRGERWGGAGRFAGGAGASAAQVQETTRRHVDAGRALWWLNQSASLLYHSATTQVVPCNTCTAGGAVAGCWALTSYLLARTYPASSAHAPTYCLSRHDVLMCPMPTPPPPHHQVRHLCQRLAAQGRR